jgi:hypothetical protein
VLFREEASEQLNEYIYGLKYSTNGQQQRQQLGSGLTPGMTFRLARWLVGG